MELKNQILLVILIPIILILFTVVLQVGILGFINIPEFQDSLLDFHITRHLNGLIIETNIMKEELFIQYQAFLNQFFGIAAHLKFYGFGELKDQNDWDLNQQDICHQSFIYSYNIDSPCLYDWRFQNYQDLSQLKEQNQKIYNRLQDGLKSLDFVDILLNNSRTLFDDMKQTNLTAPIADTEIVPIDFEYAEVSCSDSLYFRYPKRSSEDRSKILEENNFPHKSVKNKSLDDGSFNFTLEMDDQSSQPGIIITYEIYSDLEVNCNLKVKMLNNYLQYLTQIHDQGHKNQSEKDHNLFVALIPANYTTVSPKTYEYKSLSTSLFLNIIEQKLLSITDDQKEMSQQGNLLDQIVRGNITNENQVNKSLFTYKYLNYEYYFIIFELNLTSKKKIFTRVDPMSQLKYLHIEPEGNNFTYPSFVIVHTFERTSLIDQLFKETSLNEVKILEIIVFVIIVVLSITIFAFVWFTANKIGQSFQDPIVVLTNFMNSIDIQSQDLDEKLSAYQDYFNSFEIKALYKTMNIFVTTIKYSNQKYSNSKHSDAIALMELSKAKDFYKKEIGNMSAVGICANNIGILHMKAHRVFEAVNEMEEAIQIAKQELLDLKDLKKWCKNMIEETSEENLIQQMKKKIIDIANKVRQIEIGFITKLQRKRSESQKKLKFNPRQKLQNKIISHTQLNQKSTMNHVALIAKTQTGAQQGSVSLQKGANYRIDISNQISIDQEMLSPSQSNRLFPLRGSNNQSNNQSSLLQSQRIDLKESIMLDSKPQLPENELQQSGQIVNTQTELDLLEEKLEELKKKKELAREKLMNRQFQLAQFMFKICMQYSDVFIPETLQLFKSFELYAEQHQKMSKSKLVRMIKLAVKKAFCYIQIGDIGQFQEEQRKADELYIRLITNDFENQEKDQDYNFVDMFKNVPTEILHSKILQLKALFELLQGNFQNAAHLLTQILEQGEYYDPEVRDFCLIVLESIFKLYNIPTTAIQQYRSQIQINVYEIVMMIDYSKKMSTEQINLAHSICTKVFHVLQPQDLVGLYAFNCQLHEAFPLQPKGTYKDLLLKQFYQAITAPGGESKLYNALKFATKNLFQHKIDYLKNSINVIKDQLQQNGSCNSKTESGLFNEEINEDYQSKDNAQIPSILNQKDDETSSSDESEISGIQFIRKAFSQAKGLCCKKEKEEGQFYSRYKYICLFTES